MIAAAIVTALAVLAVIAKRQGDRVVEEILAAELRQIERDRVNQQHAANVGARWSRD